MPFFDYKVKDDMGRVIHGVVTAKDMKEVKRKANRSSLFFISAKRINEKTLFNQKVKFRTLITFTNRLATLIDAGIPILTAMNILWRQTEEKTIQIAVSCMRSELEEGSAVSAAMEKFKKIFPPVYRALVRVGESGGALSQILQKLASYLEYKAHLIQRTKSATLYPLIVIIFSIIVVFALFLFVVPVFDTVLSKLNVELPLLTKIILVLSNMLRTPWFYGIVFIVVVLALGLLKILSLNPKFGYHRDKLIIQIPYFGDIIKFIALSQFVRSLSILLAAGMPVIESINISSSTTGNEKINGDLEVVKREIEQGVSLYESFKRSRGFPIMMVEMIGVGESTGMMVTILDKVTKQMDDDVEYSLNRFLTILEPVLIIFVGGIVLTVLLAIYLPIISIWQGLGLK